MKALELRSSTEINYYFLFFVVTLIFGVFFNEFIGFDPLDELLEVGLIVIFLILSIWKGELRFGKMGVIWLTSFLFYLGYSFYIGSNAPKAIFLDVLLQAKPFIAFFCIYYAGQKFSDKEKRVLRIIVMILYALALLALAASFMFSRLRLGLSWFFGHEAKFATAIVILALLYLYSSPDKILFYAQGFFLDRSIEDHNLARPVLYMTSVEILQDYFPFGSGFGSFATHASRVVYSPIYEAYEISGVWGLSEEFSAFIADTHFPSLAQFGVVGVVLFILFWRTLIKKANACKLSMPDNSAYFFIVLIFVFLMIEMVADAAFTNNRGFFSMLFLGYLFNEYKSQPLKVAE
ncbi:MAG: hypothetical protein LC643_06115 [Bacteroidales bacterium]|nr:hypothetical protein [Bacteroidales bacterium]